MPHEKEDEYCFMAKEFKKRLQGLCQNIFYRKKNIAMER